MMPVLLAGLSAACGSGAEPARPSGQGGSRALNVRVAPVAARDVVYRVQALGSLEAEELVQVTAEVEGAVTQVLFHEGDRVTAETVLARIDPGEVPAGGGPGRGGAPAGGGRPGAGAGGHEAAGDAGARTSSWPPRS